MAKMGDYKLQGLKDSRILYLRNPPRFMTIAVIIVIAVLLGATMWSCIAVKAEQVENAGIVVDTGANSISTEVSGTIKSIYAKEGDRVQAGDLIFAMDSSSLQTQRNGYADSLDHFEKRVTLIEKWIDSVKEDKPNPFVDTGDESEFFNMRAAYDSEVDAILNTGQAEALNQKYLNSLYTQRSDLQGKINTANAYQAIVDDCQTEIGYIKKILKAIEENSTSNPFNPSKEGEAEYYVMFQTYRSQYDNVPVGDSQTYQREQLKGNYVYNLSTKLSEKNNQVSQCQAYITPAAGHPHRVELLNRMVLSLERGSMSNPYDRESTDPVEIEFFNTFKLYLAEHAQLGLETKAEQTKMKYIINLESDENTSENQILQLNTQIAACDANIDKYSIKAANVGTVHLNIDLKLGETIQAGTAIGTINSGSGLEVNLYVSAHDRARISPGDECKFTVDGLMQSEFGCIKGTIKSIANDATMSENGAFFKVVVSFTDVVLKDKDGKEVEIINGMTVRVWTIYEKYTYMEYFLDRLGL